MIETIETRFGGRMARVFGSVELATAQVAPALWPFFLHRRPEQPFVEPLGESDVPVAIAFVNHGRWSAQCPFCSSSQHVSHDDPRFFCADCFNVEAGSCYVPVRLPAVADLARIEELLLVRPFVTTRNWQPGEPLEQLAAENEEHGL